MLKYYIFWVCTDRSFQTRYPSPKGKAYKKRYTKILHLNQNEYTILYFCVSDIRIWCAELQIRTQLIAKSPSKKVPWTGTKNVTCRIGLTFRYLLGSIWNFKGFQILFVRTSGTIFAAWVAQNSSQRKHFFQRHHIFKHVFCMCQTLNYWKQTQNCWKFLVNTEHNT